MNLIAVFSLQVSQERYNSDRAGNMRDRKRIPIVLFLMPLIIGLAGLSRVINSSNFALYRTVDVVQLLGSGVCFGASMVGVIMLLRHRAPDTFLEGMHASPNRLVDRR